MSQSILIIKKFTVDQQALLLTFLGGIFKPLKKNLLRIKINLEPGDGLATYARCISFSCPVTAGDMDQNRSSIRQLMD